MPTDFTASVRDDQAGGPNKNTLVVRAGVARTFGGLGGFLAIMFLGSGVYLLQEAFSDPLRAEAVGLIAGAFILALATVLLYFIFSPPPGYGRSKIRKRNRLRAGKHRVESAPPSTVPLTLPKLPASPPAEEERGEGLPSPA